MKGTGTILMAQVGQSPFFRDTNNNLRNILNGVNADSNVDPETTKSVGEKILLSLNGINYSFRRNKCQGSDYGIKVIREDCR